MEDGFNDTRVGRSDRLGVMEDGFDDTRVGRSDELGVMKDGFVVGSSDGKNDGGCVTNMVGEVVFIVVG